MEWTPHRLHIFDTEYWFPPGSDGVPVGVCIVCHSYEISAHGLIPVGVFVSGWEEMRAAPPPPWLNDPDGVVVAFAGNGDIQVMERLGWGRPAHYCDYMMELRRMLCGHPGIDTKRAGLYQYLDHFQIPHPPKTYKNNLRELILSGASHRQKSEVLDYCSLDVALLAELVAKTFSLVDWSRAVGVRGEMMKAYSRIEARGLPIDTAFLGRLERNWPAVQAHVRCWVNRQLGFQIYDGSGVFKKEAVEQWLASRGLLARWPRTKKDNAIELKSDELRNRAKSDSQFAVLYEATKTLGQGSHGLRLEVHSDGRARTWLNAMGTKTARCAPREPDDSKGFDRGGGFLFSGARWIRSLLKPSEGMAVAYLDFSGQEILIAAALSNDGNLMECYTAHDPYVRFAQLAGALPDGATKKTHPEIRAKFKTVFLGLSYSMGAESLAARLNCTVSEAAGMVAMHRKIFRKYWAWNDAVRVRAYETKEIRNVFGWRMTVHNETKPTSLTNWPIQANGSAMLAAAVIELDRAGIRVVGSVHDAFLLEAPAAEIDTAAARAAEIMAQASLLTTGGTVPCRVDAKIIRYPNRYHDDDDGGMFERIQAALEMAERGKVAVHSGLTYQFEGVPL